MRDALTLLHRLAAAALDRLERALGIHDDDLMAIVRATHETATPIGDAALMAVVHHATQIEAAMDEWRAEVAALADAELAELLEEEQ